MKKSALWIALLGITLSSTTAYAIEFSSYSNGLTVEDSVEYYVPLSNDDELLQATSIPNSYDLRSSDGKCRITSPKDQGVFSTCWAFSLINAVESSLISQGYADTSIDLSELSLIYFCKNRQGDLLGNLNNDRVYTAPLKNYLTEDGTHYSAIATLMSGSGLVDEPMASYGLTNEATPVLSPDLQYGNYRLTESRTLSMKNASYVKEMITEWGAGATGVSMDLAPSSINEFAEGEYALYVPTSTKANHGVSLIGWDDNFPKGNFSQEPNNNGAWLLQNSYGSNIEYFWVSYEDPTLANTLAYFVKVTPDKKADNTYQYDGTNGLYSYPVPTGNTVVSHFDIKGGAELEELKGISFGTHSGNVTYSVQIYKNSPMDNPLGGTQVLSSPVVGQTHFAGFYDIPFDTPVSVQQGDTVDVALTVISSKPSDPTSTVLVDMDKSGATLSTVSENYMEQNQCYVIGDAVTDLYNLGYTPRLKLYTNNHSHDFSAQIVNEKTRCSVATLYKPATYYYSCAGCSELDKTRTFEYGSVLPNYVKTITLSPTSISMFRNATNQLTATVTPMTTSLPYTKTVKYTSSNPAVAKVSSKGLVTGVTKGTATIVAEATDGSGVKATCRVTIRQQVTSISLNTYKKVIKKGNKYTITPKVYPSTANNRAVNWTTSDKTIATISADGVATAKKNGTVTITCKAKDGSKVTRAMTLVVGTPVSRVTLNRATSTLKVGSGGTLKATVYPSTSSIKSVSWTSSDPSVATVTSKGYVKALKKGKSTITVKSKDGNNRKATCVVTVK